MLISNLEEAATTRVHIHCPHPCFHFTMHCLLKTTLWGGHCFELLSTNVGTDVMNRRVIQSYIQWRCWDSSSGWHGWLRLLPRNQESYVIPFHQCYTDAWKQHCHRHTDMGKFKEVAEWFKLGKCFLGTEGSRQDSKHREMVYRTYLGAIKHKGKHSVLEAQFHMTRKEYPWSSCILF